MAAKRMFLRELIDSDLFLEMPATAQNLYFHLGMRADDDGFINNSKKIMRAVRSSEDDLKILLVKHLVIKFESGVVVITHWLLNNQIRKDRYKETIHKKEKACLRVTDGREYEIAIAPMDTNGLPDGNHMTPQISLDKNRLVQDRKEKYRLESEVITETDYMRLIQEYPERVVEEVICKILSKPYRNCLNTGTIAQWCEQRISSHHSGEDIRNNQNCEDILMRIAMERR